MVIASIEDLKLEIKADGSIIAVLIVEVALVAKSYVVICEGKINLFF